MNMKKMLVFPIVFLIVIATAAALVTYTGAPQMPYIIYGVVDWNSQGLGSVDVQITNSDTGYVVIVKTNSDGYWQQDSGNWLTSSAGRTPVVKAIPGVYPGDTIRVKALDGCGTADTCEKVFNAGASGYADWASVDLSLTGVLVSTPEPSSSSGGGSGGGGGGGSGGSGVVWDCGEWSVCQDNTQSRTCTQKGVYTKSESQECIVLVEPPVVKPPVIPPVEPPVDPCEGNTQCGECGNSDCLIVPPDDEETLKDFLIKLIAVIIGVFAWGAGFKGLILYYLNEAKKADAAGDKELAKKHRARAEKMAKTVITNFLAGKYKK